MNLARIFRPDIRQPEFRLMVSGTVDRLAATDATPLNGATLTGTRYVYLTDTGMRPDLHSGITSVVWTLDGSSSPGFGWNGWTQTQPTWDFNGTNPTDLGSLSYGWDTSQIGNGSHRIVADVTHNGNPYRVSASFSVNNVVAPPPSTTPLAGTNYDNAATIDAIWAPYGYQVNSPSYIRNVAAPSGFTVTTRSGQGRVLEHYNTDAPTFGTHERAEVWNANSSVFGGMATGQTRYYSISFAVGSAWGSNPPQGWSFINQYHSSYNPPSGGQSYSCVNFQLGTNWEDDGSVTLVPAGGWTATPYTLWVATFGAPVTPDGNLFPTGTRASQYRTEAFIANISPNTWYDMAYEVRLSSEGDALLRVYVNGSMVRELSRATLGRNYYIGLRSPESYYWKQGHTRSPTSSGANVIYHDNTYRWASIQDAIAYFGW